MGRRLKFETGLCRAVVLCAGLGFVLGGCAGQKPETGNRKPEVNKVEIPSPENFTTLGKPTKTIQTPNGPVEIYDPTQDPEVRAAFDEIYRRDYSETSEYYAQSKFYAKFNISTKDGEHGPWHVDDKARIIFNARRVHYQDIMRSGCDVLLTSSCNVSYNRLHPTQERLENQSACDLESHFGKLETSECEKNIYRGYLAGSESSCVLNATRQTSIIWSSIGSHPYPKTFTFLGQPPPPKPSKKQQLTEFFNYQCSIWTEQ